MALNLQKLCTSLDSCSSNAKNTLDRSCAYKYYSIEGRYYIRSFTVSQARLDIDHIQCVLLTAINATSCPYKLSQPKGFSSKGRRNEVNLHWGWLGLARKTDKNGHIYGRLKDVCLFQEVEYGPSTLWKCIFNQN